MYRGICFRKWIHGVFTVCDRQYNLNVACRHVRIVIRQVPAEDKRQIKMGMSVMSKGDIRQYFRAVIMLVVPRRYHLKTLHVA